jgi:hypothetical protein
MLLDIEVFVRIPSTDGEDVGEGHAKRVGKQLGHKSYDVDTGITEGEELVDTGSNEDEDLSWLQ